MPSFVTLKPGMKLTTTRVNLYGRYGDRYVNTALEVPGYGVIPCSKALCNSFTNDSSKLMLLITEPDDEYKPYTSDIWITLSNVIRTL